GRAEVHVLRSAAHEVALVADRLRRAHLTGGVPWSRMAVLVRGRQRAASLRRGLQQSGVPVDVPLTEVPVRDQTAVVPLLDAYEIVLALAAGEPALGPEQAVSLLMSPLGGADAIAVRRLRQALRADDTGNDDGNDGEDIGRDIGRDAGLHVGGYLGGRGRSSDELLVEALLEPSRLGSLDPLTAEPAQRVARVLAAGVAAVTQAGEAATAETLLWAIWAASGLAGPWQRAALASGASGARADRDLDAVVALFDAATRFVDRLPQAGARAFVEYLRGQDVAADTLAERASGEAVALLTPAAAAGREWDVVVVAGVQDGVWPDLRLRGSLLGAERLVDVLAGREPSLRGDLLAVRDDETRLLHVAVSRARSALLVTAVRDEDEQPSAFVDLVDPPPDALPAAGWDAEGVRTVSLPTHPLTLSGVVARLRQQVCGGGPAAAAAARRLARLAAEGVPGAHPDDWYGVAELTDDRPLATGEPVRVSPSKVEAFERCGLRWLLTAAGGTAPTSASQGLGTLVHALAEELPDADADTLLAELRRRWHVLGWGDGFAGDVQRQRAERVVRKLADYLAGARELVASELDVDVVLDLPHGQARVVGRVDRLERDADGLHVIDLKTGKQAPAAKELPEQPQLGTYQLLGLAGGFDEHAPGVPVAGAALVQLGGTEKRPKVQRQEALPGDGGWAVELVDRVAHGMAQHRFVATVNDLCDRCPVRTSCPARPEGRQVTS
ncbi:MAG: PD-(D/E)XK nuclease family protein, partial [Angustibacter sp.]